MHNQEPITVLLVDDHPLMRKGLRTLLASEKGLSVVGEASDGKEALDQVRTLAPDIVVMDITMPNLNGIEATRQILAEVPGTRIVALSIHAEKRFVESMLKAGAAAYVLKDCAPEELVCAINSVLRGEAFVSAPILGIVVSGYRKLEEEPAKAISEESDQAGVVDVLQTKLHRPALPNDVVPRTTLLERLETGRTRPLTLVAAGAGYGKSVLVSSWLEACEWRSAWLSLDEDDGELRRFLSYFIAAVKKVFPQACKDSLELTSAIELPPVSVIATTLGNDLDSLAKPFILVLDDYHRIAARSPVHDLLQQLLNHPPIPLHLVILTRSDPPLSLVNLYARDQITVVRMEDLRFTQAETRALLEKTVHVTTSSVVMNKLEQEMEGWVVGLRLVLLVLRHVENPDGFLENMHGGIQQAGEYLLQEVLNRQPPQMRDRILKLAILDRFCVPLCAAVCATEGGTGGDEYDREQFHQKLLNSDLFVIPLDNQVKWFRYHHLFQSLLQHELQQHLTADEIAALHVRASEWFERQGLVEEALNHILAAGDAERAAQIIERSWRAVMNDGRWYVPVRWLSLLPQSLVQDRPQLLLIQAWKHYYHLEVAALPAVLDRIDDLMGSDEQDFSGEVAVFRGFYAMLVNKGALSLKYIEYALDRIHVTDAEFRGQAEIIFGLSGQMEGQKGRVVRTLTESLNTPPPLSALREDCLLWTLTCMHYISGDPQETRLFIPRQREVARSHHGGQNFLAWCDYFDGLIALQQGELDTAIRALEKASKRKYYHYTRAAADALIVLTLAYQARGKPEQATETLHVLREFINHLGPVFSTLFDSCTARLALMQGRQESAVHWLKASNPAPEVMLCWQEVPSITYCRVLIEEGLPTGLQQAIELLHEYEQMNVALHNTVQLINILALQALAYAKQNKVEKGSEVLKRALLLAQPGSFIFVFLESGKPMLDLLALISAEDSNAAYVLQKISSIIEVKDTAEKPGISNPVNQRRWNSLTPRERDILKLLAERLQNKEIAARLFVSHETIKSYLKRIYEKLDVHNRRDAALEAKELLKTTNK